MESAARGPKITRALIFAAGLAAVGYGQWCWMTERLQRGYLPILLGIFFIAISCAKRWLGPPAPGEAARPPFLAEAVFLALVVVFAASVRFIGLETTPPGGFFDEVQNHFVAEDILHGSRPVFIADWTKMPALFFYVLAAAIKVFGRGLATVRGLSALLGTLAVPVFYFLARRAFAWPVAAAATILLAGSRWHVAFSRVGFATIAGPLLEVSALLALWRAMERRSLSAWLLFGAVMGIGLQTYYSFNLFPFVLAVAVVTYAARQGARLFPAELWAIAKGLALSIAVAVLLLLPLLIFAAKNPKVFFERSREVAIWNPAHGLPWPSSLFINARTNLLMFHFHGDYNPRHNIPNRPMIEPAEGFLLLVGIGASLAGIFRWPQATWLTWFIALLMPAILTIESPQAHRALGVVPAVYLLIAQGLQPLYTFAARAGRRAGIAIAAVLLLAGSAAAAWKDMTLYFGPQTKTSLAWSEFQADHHAIGRFLKPLANQYDIFVSPLYMNYNIERFHLGADFPYERFRLFEHFPISPAKVHPNSKGLLYVLEPFQEGLFPLFHSVYPGATMTLHKDPYGRTMFVEIRVPPDEIRIPPDSPGARGGFLGSFWTNRQATGNPVIQRREPAIWLHSHWELDPLPHPFFAEWTTWLRTDQAGVYNFELASSGPTVVSLDKEKVFETSLDTSDPQRFSVSASAGRHLLAVGYWENSYRATITLAWQPPGGKPEVIPLDVTTPLTAQEYASIRGELPRPRFD
jgi:hypothetical protein